MKEIKLTQGKLAIVDDEDYEYLNKYKWGFHRTKTNNYAISSHRGIDLKMHRLILGLTKGDKKEVDHINRNGLDNRKENLRLCTRQQNCYNRQPQHGRTSKYKGVSWFAESKKWRALIMNNGILIHLGLFENEIDAVRVYDKAAKELFGEFAYLNFKE